MAKDDVPDERDGATSDGDDHEEVDTTSAEAALKARLSKKRTKTGCLTCRKRRIKCGEERPVCRNCVKSKRHCEGYSHRVIFKPPTFDVRLVSNGGAHITFQAGPAPGPVAPIATSESLVELRPRPQEGYEHMFYQPLPQQVPQVDLNLHQPWLHQQPQLQYMPLPPEMLPDGFGQDPQQFLPHQVVPQYPPTRLSAPQPGLAQMNSWSHPAPQQPEVVFHHYQPVQAHEQLPSRPLPRSQPQVQAHERDARPNETPTQDGFRRASTVSGIPIMAGFPSVFTGVAPIISPATSYSSQTVSTGHENSNDASQAPWMAGGWVPRPELLTQIDYHPPITVMPQSNSAFVPRPPPTTTSQPVDPPTPFYYDQEAQLSLTYSPTLMLNQAAIEAQDDDYYDIHSDEEMDLDSSDAVQSGQQNQETLNLMLVMNRIVTGKLAIRRDDTFVYDGMLDSYRAERVANPLKNAATARVFAHFISATGPSLSIFERHPRNASVLFSNGPVPMSQQGLWTYTMPMAALHHQGLLHAMLALASLHIAKLQGASTTPSYQHYAWALKRIHHCVGHPKKRLQLPTIAASQLLGFYEIMTADHMKWNSHLLGAKQLMVETDFAGMTRQFKRMKVERAARLYKSSERSGRRRYIPHASLYNDNALDQIPEIDERLVSNFSGRVVRYDDHGRILDGNKMPPPLDLGKYEVLKDLFWWYCKQDVYQSIISGNPLLMPYSRWTDCPPRAPLGKSDAVYGSFDHLVLLLARIADFASRDRERKLRVMEAQGGGWRPAPGMRIGPPPSGQSLPSGRYAPQMRRVPPVNAAIQAGQHPGATVAPPPGPPPQMPFYGMAPPPPKAHMPSSYSTNTHSHTPITPQVDFHLDLAAATQLALDQYGQLRAALLDFANCLGDAYKPLTADYQPPLETPFGSALFYRSYDISVLMAVYNMAVIITIRSHPYMPPAAHMAASVAADETAPYASEVGRIVAALVPGPPDQPLNPNLGAALCETCIPSFFAGIQFRDAEQRRSTVMRIFSIEQRTGWGTAGLIANGCETAWVKAAQAGRGPPYERVMRPKQSDDARLNGSWEHLDPNSQPNEKDEQDRRLVRVNATARLNWAIGVMGTEDDIER